MAKQFKNSEGFNDYAGANVRDEFRAANAHTLDPIVGLREEDKMGTDEIYDALNTMDTTPDTIEVIGLCMQMCRKLNELEYKLVKIEATQPNGSLEPLARKDG